MKILVVGCGGIGKKHVENATKFAQVGVVDIDKEVTKNLCESFLVKDFEEDLDFALQWKPDGVIISTPNKFHFKHTIKALESGSHVLVEKPLALTLMEIDNIIKKSNYHKKKVFVVCNLRFNDCVNAIKNNLYKIGKPMFGNFYFGFNLAKMRKNIDYRKLYVADKIQGGVLLDNIHEIDYVQWIFGKGQILQSLIRNLSELEIKSEDYATITLEHENNFISNFQLDFIRQVRQRGCKIVGTLGILDWTSEGKNPEKRKVKFLNQKNEIEIILDDNLKEMDNSLYLVVENFVNSINDNHTILQTCQEARHNLKLTLQARNTI